MVENAIYFAYSVSDRGATAPHFTFLENYFYGEVWYADSMN